MGEATIPGRGSDRPGAARGSAARQGLVQGRAVRRVRRGQQELRRPHAGGARPRPAYPQGGVPDPARAVRLGQDHLPDDAPPASRRRRRAPSASAGAPCSTCRPASAASAWCSRTTALFPHMTVGENLSFPLEVRGIDPERRGERVRRALRLVRLDGLGRAPAGPALRWPAAARGHCPRPGLRAGTGADGRAARRARPAPARGAAVRDPAHPPRPRGHRPVRHPRPAGSDGDVGSRRCLPGRDASSRSPRPKRSTRSRSGRSWPASSARTTGSRGG